MPVRDMGLLQYIATLERQEQEQLDVLFAEYKVRTHWANVEKNA